MAFPHQSTLPVMQMAPPKDKSPFRRPLRKPWTATVLIFVLLLGFWAIAVSDKSHNHSTDQTQGAPGQLDLERIPWEGGPTYWDNFGKTAEAGWNDPHFIPIALWHGGISSSEEVAFDQQHGFNTYIGMWEGTPYHLFEEGGAFWIGGALNPSFTPDAKNWVGRMIDDEVDGRFTPTEGRAHMQDIIDGFPSDGRFDYANFTQTVMSKHMAKTDSQAYINGFTDAVSIDMYWYTIPFCGQSPYGGESYIRPVQKANCRTASSYGKTMDSLRSQDVADGRLQMLWQFIELYNGGPGGGQVVRVIAPEELKGAVMNSVINEARGIVYFNQSLSGECQSGNVVRQVQMGETCASAQVKAAAEVNAQLHNLAPVINSQSYKYSFGSGLDTMLKTHDEAAYIFAMIDGETRPGTRTLTLPPELHGRSVEVLFEDRTIEPDSNGQFKDAFDHEWTYHIYRIR